MQFMTLRAFLATVLVVMGGIVVVVMIYPGESSKVSGEVIPPSMPEERKLPLMPEAQKKKIVRSLNSLIWILAQVKHHNDVKAVQDAKRWLQTDYLNYNVIKDRMLVQTIDDINKFIIAVEIDAGDRALAEEVYEHETSRCLWEAFSGVSCGGAINPVTAVANLATSAVGGYMQYRKALADKQLEYRKEKWEMDKNMLREVNNLEADLNTCISDLTQRYDFPDGWRIGSNDAVMLADVLKWPDKAKALHELCLETNVAKYEYLPQYWLQRGLLEFALYRESGAMEMLSCAQNSVDRYIRDYENINRNSDDLVLAASAMIGIKGELFMKKGSSPEATRSDEERAALAQEIEKLIGIIETNSDRSRLEENWKNDYVVYAAYKMLGRDDVAEQKLKELVDRLQQSSSQTDSPGIRPGRPKYKEPLNACLTELNTLIQGKEMNAGQFAAILNDRYVASQKKLVLFGKLDAAELKQRVANELKGVELVMDSELCSEDELTLKLPISWFLYARPVFTVYGMNKEGKKILLSTQSEEQGKIAMCRDETDYMLITFYTSQWKPFYKEGEIGIYINYPSVDQPVFLRFRKPDIKQPSEVLFGWDANTKSYQKRVIFHQ